MKLILITLILISRSLFDDGEVAKILKSFEGNPILEKSWEVNIQ